MAGSLGYNKSFAVSSSGRSGGLGIFWNDEIKLEVVGYSRYHIDVVMDELVDSKTRVTFVYGEAQVNERYKTWDKMRELTDNLMLRGYSLEILMKCCGWRSTKE